MAGVLNHFDHIRYHLYGWVVMDDHVHVIVDPQDSRLSHLLHSWKSYSAHQLQRQMGRQGSIWQDESFDRVIRDEDELFEKAQYVVDNPRRRWPDVACYVWVFPDVSEP